MITREAVQKILKQAARRQISPQKAYHKLRHLSYESLGFAKIDHHRVIRKGFPEAVYAPGKTIHELRAILKAVYRSKQPLLVTRLEKKTFRTLKRSFRKLHYSLLGRLAYDNVPRTKSGGPPMITIISAGTSDGSIAEEAAVTLEVFGTPVRRIYDCGVAGLHRLLDQLSVIKSSKVIICVAGMEGALPSVVAGLVPQPVIAVPTSMGYGSNFKGIAPLLTMLNSCAPGVAVVNIDNGFGAACFAQLLLKNR